MTTAAIAPSQQSARLIRQRLPGFQPRVAMILGSGLGPLAEEIEEPVSLPYAELPGFPLSTVVGHAGELVLGRLQGVDVMCMRGRGHYYEGYGIDVMTQAVRTMKLLGCEVLLSTSAAGSVRPDIGPGRFVAIRDHVNLLPGTPLIGPNDESVGPRFPSLANAYDRDLRAQLESTAVENRLPWAEGVYVCCAGPDFGTPAEFRMIAGFGGDVVGMSMVPEVISARHCGLKVLGIAIVTNFTEGLSAEPITHEQTLKYASLAAVELRVLIHGWLRTYARTPAVTER